MAFCFIHFLFLFFVGWCYLLPLVLWLVGTSWLVDVCFESLLQGLVLGVVVSRCGLLVFVVETQ